MPYVLLAAVLLLLTGCVNERGISARYYNDCREYYDMRGAYHKKCDENIVDYDDIKEAFTEKPPAPEGNVW